MPTPPPPPVIPSGQEIYDSIMSQIEPELVSSVLPTLKEKYAHETPEEKQARGERYQKAFEQYDNRFAEYSSALHEKVTAYRKQALQSAEEEDRKQAEQILTEMESLIQNA